MGNLLGAPVTDKETHSGRAADGVQYAVSSMQGWRVHMEDAHITEPTLYVIKEDKATTTTASDKTANNNSTTSTSSPASYQLEALPGHSLFAVFDGHGGSYAAIYAGRNLCRVLSRQPLFHQYADALRKHEAQSARLSETAVGQLNDLLQRALTQAFCDVDAEIALALQGNPVPEADQPYPPTKENLSNKNTTTATNTTNNNNASSTTTTSTSATSESSNNSTNPDDARNNTINIDEEGDSGTTACVVLLTPHSILCANAGDSRSVLATSSLSDSDAVIPLSFDHKPDDAPEEARIRAAGGYVAGGRVEGDLAVSRGLGDFRFKDLGHVAGRDPAVVGQQKVSPVPDCVVLSRTTNNNNSSSNSSSSPKQQYILVACDGIFDVQTNEQAVELVNSLYTEGETDLALMCEEVADICLQLGSKDNMTVLLVQLEAPPPNSTGGGGVLARRQKRQEQAQAREQSTGP